MCVILGVGGEPAVVTKNVKRCPATTVSVELLSMHRLALMHGFDSPATSTVVRPVEEARVASPEYHAATVDAPSGAAAEVQLPFPPLSVATQRLVEPIENVTVPEGCVDDPAATVAEYVTT